MNVKIIASKNQTALVEWEDADGLHRGYIPEEVIYDNVVDDDVLSIVIPYGLEWEYIIGDLLNKVTPREFSKNLRKAGIWSMQDLRSNPSVVFGAIQQTYGLDFSTLVLLTEKYLKEIDK
jgi:hypothetical protein